jgi:hypothetical protein
VLSVDRVSDPEKFHVVTIHFDLAWIFAFHMSAPRARPPATKFLNKLRAVSLLARALFYHFLPIGSTAVSFGFGFASSIAFCSRARMVKILARCGGSRADRQHVQAAIMDFLPCATGHASQPL